MRFALVLPVLLVLGACQKEAPKAAPKRVQIGWRPVVMFSGEGSTQTESFNMESTQWRIKWTTTDETAPGKGTFHLVVHSAVSGRPIMEAVSQQGVGSGIAYVGEDPRLYHLVIDSSGVKWSIAVEEGVVSQ